MPGLLCCASCLPLACRLLRYWLKSFESPAPCMIQVRLDQAGDQEWPTHESWLTYFVTVSPSSRILSMICFRFGALLSVLPSSPPATHCLSPTIDKTYQVNLKQERPRVSSLAANRKPSPITCRMPSQRIRTCRECSELRNCEQYRARETAVLTHPTQR